MYFVIEFFVNQLAVTSFDWLASRKLCIIVIEAEACLHCGALLDSGYINVTQPQIRLHNTADLAYKNMYVFYSIV